jgi:hypothetical protein
LLSYLLPYSERSIALVKRLAGSPRAEIDNLPTLTKCYSGSTHSYIHGWTSFSRTKLCPTVAILPSSIFPRSIALVKRLVHQRADPNLPHANKVLLKVAHAFFMDGLLSVALCPSRCYLTFFHIRTFNCTSKTTGWFKGLKLINLTLTKCYSSTRILIYMDGLLSVAQTVPKPLLSYLLPYSQRSIALVKRLAGSPRAEIDPNLLTLTKCYSR